MRIENVHFDSASLPAMEKAFAEERAAAVRDLVASGEIQPEGMGDGPCELTLGLEESRLLIEVHEVPTQARKRFALPLKPFKPLIRDYFFICESYRSALEAGSLERVEAIDMGRRGLHNEASEQLMSLLQGKLAMNRDTARRLFTLVFSLCRPG